MTNKTGGKWGRIFWIDLAERVGTTLIYGLITMFTLNQSFSELSAEQLWIVVVLPTLLSLLKGLSANLKDPSSGASLVPPWNQP